MSSSPLPSPPHLSSRLCWCIFLITFIYIRVHSIYPCQAYYNINGIILINNTTKTQIIHCRKSVRFSYLLLIVQPKACLWEGEQVKYRSRYGSMVRSGLNVCCQHNCHLDLYRSSAFRPAHHHRNASCASAAAVDTVRRARSWDNDDDEVAPHHRGSDHSWAACVRVYNLWGAVLRFYWVFQCVCVWSVATLTLHVYPKECRKKQKEKR